MHWPSLVIYPVEFFQLSHQSVFVLKPPHAFHCHAWELKSVSIQRQSFEGTIEIPALLTVPSYSTGYK